MQEYLQYFLIFILGSYMLTALTVALSTMSQTSVSKKIILSGPLMGQAVIIMSLLSLLTGESSLIDMAVIYVILGFLVPVLIFFSSKAAPGFLKLHTYTNKSSEQ